MNSKKYRVMLFLCVIVMIFPVLSSAKKMRLQERATFNPHVELDIFFSKALRLRYRAVKFYRFKGKSLRKFEQKVIDAFPHSLKSLSSLKRENLFSVNKFLVIFYGKKAQILGGAFLFKGSVLSCFVCDHKGRWVKNLFIDEKKLYKKEWSYSGGRLFSWKQFIVKDGISQLLKTNLYTPEIDYFIEASGVSFKVKRKYFKKALLRKKRFLKLKKNGLIPFKMGSHIVYFEEFVGKKNDRTFLFVHPDEITAYRELKKYLLKNNKTGYLFIGNGERLSKRGRYLSIKIGRKIFYFDPNRVFSHKHRHNFLLTRKYYRYAIYNRAHYYRQYRKQFHQYINVFHEFMVVIAMVRKGPLITVHDNDEVMKWANKIFRGHNYGISKLSYRNKDMPTSDFFYVTQQKDYNYCKQNNLNVILQDNAKIKDDGSASIEFARKNKRYFCIEVKRKGKNSKKIIQRMLRLVGKVK